MCHLLLRELLVCAFVRSLKTHNGVEPGHWNQQRRQTDHPWRLCCWSAVGSRRGVCVCDSNAPRFPVTTFVCLNGPLKSRVEVNSLLAGRLQLIPVPLQLTHLFQIRPDGVALLGELLVCAFVFFIGNRISDVRPGGSHFLWICPDVSSSFAGFAGLCVCSFPENSQWR